ncbi:unnamed protein product [Lactuca virosa]|uniref:Amino acid transporter transmembrane domain-containing protein n=1 Tax=Lactuca virosa TaxID=75947 RepID=A0AAU9M412_9ASTR|nr:unnamed protein product [Lactuca virosa]
MDHVNKQDDYSLIIPLLVTNGDVGTKGKEEQYTNNTAIGTASFISTCFNALNALSGVGILSIPYALASGGWLTLILLLVIASSTFFTGLLIQRCMDSDPTIRTYPDIGERAFGKAGRTLISISMKIELYLVATASGVLASVIILCSVFWAGAFDGIGFQEKGNIVKWNGVPSAISLYAFCYCAHPVFPTLYTSMKNQRQFTKVLFFCFAFSTITYSLMAVIGYLMFGSKVESEITLNLPTNKLSSRVAIFTTLVTPIAKYALMLTPIVDTIETQFQSFCNKRKCSFLIRTILMISTVVFGNLMSLVGALLSATASITIPCLCYLKISGIYKRIGMEMIIVWFVGLIGLIVAVVGTYVSLVHLKTHLFVAI